MLDERGRRRAVGFEHEAGAVGLVPVAELVEQLLRGAERARRAGAEHMVFLALVLDRKAPARILRAEAGEHRLARMHGHHEGPGGCGIGRFERHAAKAAKADFADAASGFQAANGAHAAIDAGLPERALRDVDPQGLSVADEAFDQRHDLLIDARPIGLSPGLHGFLVHHVHSVPPSWPAQAAKMVEIRSSQAALPRLSPGAGQHSAYRAVFVDAIPAAQADRRSSPARPSFLTQSWVPLRKRWPTALAAGTVERAVGSRLL